MTFRPRTLGLPALAAWCGLTGVQAAEGWGFSRISPGWTNYSTAFNVTHDPSPDGDYATIACFYTPAVDVRPLEFSTILVWFGSGGQRLNFGAFTFQVHLWTSLEAFMGNPRRGDLASMAFAAPTGGSLTTPDAVTRGGRPAYLARFSLAGTPITLPQCQTVLIGLSAHADANRSGELYVPTAPYAGFSDVQGGNLVAFGWTYLVDAGGQTIYWGQLATELSAQPWHQPPSLGLERTPAGIKLAWPEAAGCFSLETREDLGDPSSWISMDELPSPMAGMNFLELGTTNLHRWFRLSRAPHSVFSP